ncbi:MAG: ATP-dependent metallopeptidase FtsH/Yme1/Tma family protein [Firmicutes bacterium]|nr:ATP-dependent metallopeptidase FtsH/Yme1/Tma family protein [Bacillota bacterium]
MNKLLRTLGLWLLLGLMTVSIASTFYGQKATPRKISLSTFMDNLDSGNIAELYIIGDDKVEGRLKNGEDFETYVPDISLVTDKLKDREGLLAGIEVIAEPKPTPPWWYTILPQVLSMLFFVGLWFFLLNQMQGGGNRALSFGKSRARLHVEERGKTTFADVAGVDEAKEELAEIVEFLKHPRKFVELGAQIPKGVLLVGPPGTGKTLLGRAVAGEAGVPFFIISGSDFVEMFVGVGASRVRDLFEQAKKSAPCIVFIDEIDAVGRQRGAGLGGGHDEREQTLNQLLVEMDGFESNTGIILLAATNRPDVLDPALLRPGRFDRQVVVDMPDINGREAILKVHARNKPLSEDVDLRVIARRTPGFTGADLENVLNEAAILAARHGSKKVVMADCDEAIDRVIAGPQKKSRVMSDREKDLVAFHEAGHALAGKLLPNVDPVQKVSIIPRGRMGGYTLMLPEEDRFFRTKSEILDNVVVTLAGRVAEEIMFNEISTGAENDLSRVTKVVRKMVTEYGMSEELGPLSLGSRREETVFLGRDLGHNRDYSEEVAALIDREVRRIVDESYEQARTLLTINKDKLIRLANALKERETLDGDEIDEVLSDRADAVVEESEKIAADAAAAIAIDEEASAVEKVGAPKARVPSRPPKLAESPGGA